MGSPISSCQCSIGAGRRLALDQQGEAIFEREIVEIGLAPLFVEGVGHAGEAEFM